MNTRQEISEELREWASPLADMPHTMPYNVPNGYFSTLTEQIHNTVKATGSQEPVLIWAHDMPFELPQGYFDQLPAQINNAALEQDITAGLPGNNPFTVPDTYFETLPQQILASAQKTGKKRISIHIFWKQLRWAAAAILIAGIGLGSYKILIPPVAHIAPPQAINNPQQALDKLPPAAIHDYIQQNIDDFDADAIIADMNTNNIQAMTKQLDSREIQEYLDATGWSQSE